MVSARDLEDLFQPIFYKDVERIYVFPWLTHKTINTDTAFLSLNASIAVDLGRGGYFF